MRRVLSGALALALMLAGSAAAATEAEVEAFVAAVAAIGCVVENDTQAEAVERATGFDERTLGEIVGVLLETGRAVIPPSNEGLRLTTPECR